MSMRIFVAVKTIFAQRAAVFNAITSDNIKVKVKVKVKS